MARVALMVRVALVPQAQAPPATLVARVALMARMGLLVLVARMGLVLRARATSTPSATLVVLGVGCERWWLRRSGCGECCGRFAGKGKDVGHGVCEG